MGSIKASGSESKLKLKLKPSNRVERVQQLAGSLAHRAKRMTPEQEESTLLKAVRADDERSKGRRRSRA